MTKRHRGPVYLPRGKNPKPLENPQARHPKGRIPIRRNRVDLVMETEIGDVNTSFGFASAFLAEQFFNFALESYAVRGTTLIQHGKLKGGRDGKGS